MFSHNESKKVISKNTLKSIKNSNDIEEFSGHIVAFEASTIYFDLDSSYKISISGRVRFALISEKYEYGYNTLGYRLEIFHDPKDTIFSTHRVLIDNTLKSQNLLMRLASNEELVHIKDAIADGKAIIRSMRPPSDEELSHLESINEQLALDLIKKCKDKRDKAMGILEDSIKSGIAARNLSM